MADHPAHQTIEHLTHAKMHEARLVNSALPGRLATVIPRAKSDEEIALQGAVNAKLAELEQEILKLPANPMRDRCIGALEHVVMWIEHTVTYTPVIAPDQNP